MRSDQKERLLALAEPYIALDQYGRTLIRNLYYDTPDYRLIRRSLERPVYKEKLRIRSYGDTTADSPVFLELKKKFDGVVYKRRMVMPEHQAVSWLEKGESPPDAGQIQEEIQYFCRYYGDLRPKLFLSYRREAYYDRNGGDLRITFDDDICFRRDRLSLTEAPGGTSLLEEGQILMEIKTSGGIPLWLTAFLSREKIYKASFSKYGTAYQKYILQEQLGGHIHA
jgi:hypothetical protein